MRNGMFALVDWRRIGIVTAAAAAILTSSLTAELRPRRLIEDYEGLRPITRKEKP